MSAQHTPGPRSHSAECPAKHFLNAACECGLQDRYTRVDCIADMLDDTGAYTQANEVRAVFAQRDALYEALSLILSPEYGHILDTTVRKLAVAALAKDKQE